MAPALPPTVALTRL